jgi:hypothetical protein
MVSFARPMTVPAQLFPKATNQKTAGDFSPAVDGFGSA